VLNKYAVHERIWIESLKSLVLIPFSCWQAVLPWENLSTFLSCWGTWDLSWLSHEGVKSNGMM
jgi:hypothetical protein